MKILIITDAWAPQVNGVVRTYENVCKEMRDMGVDFMVINPEVQQFKKIPLPGYKEIKIVVNPWKINVLLNNYMKDGYKFHIATEGPLGLFAKRFCEKNGMSYTTSFHTLFPEFIEKRIGIPSVWSYKYFRWFHKKSRKVLVPTIDIKNHLFNFGITNTSMWTRGVDNKIFNPQRRKDKGSYLLCVSRVSKEKGLDDFCQLKGRKVLIGDGPYLNELKRKYKDVEYLGKLQGVELAEWIASADVFVFPSKSDTFGIVILESIACGTPVASYEQPGPKIVIANNYNGHYGDNLQESVEKCYELNRNYVFDSSKGWTWKTSTEQFIEAMNDKEN